MDVEWEIKIKRKHDVMPVIDQAGYTEEKNEEIKGIW